MFKAIRITGDAEETMLPMDLASFERRQQIDFTRYEDADGEYVVRRKPYNKRLDDTTMYQRHEEYDSGRLNGEEIWRNEEGERLADFGVDEAVDFYDEDDEPLARIRQRLQNGHGKLS